MKHGKRLKLRNKKLLVAAGLNPIEWYQVKDTLEELHIVHKATGETKVIRKEG